MFSNANNLFITGGTFSQELEKPNSRGFELLAKKVATRARYDCGQLADPAKCHPDTRTAILADLEEWACNLTYDYPIRWISGSVGVGKTAIMRTTAETLEERRLLLADFFFWRTGEGCNNADLLITTLAYRIAVSIPGARSYIGRAVEFNPHIPYQDLKAQSQKLIIDPIRTALSQGEIDASDYARVILIDGLDECLEREGQTQDVDKQCEILRVLQWMLEQLPIPLALLIASRPENHIQAVFGTDLKQKSSFTMLNDSHDAEADIRRFYNDKFRGIRVHHPLRSYFPSNDWPPSERVNELVRRACGQFIYASTVVKFVGARKKNPSTQLDIILGKTMRTNVRPFQALDILYRIIFLSIDEDDLADTLRILGILLVGRENGGRHLSPSFWDRFLEWPEEGQTQRLMLGLESVVRIDGPDWQKFHFYHASLSDFLFDPSRSEAFSINRNTIFEDLAKLSIRHLFTTDEDMKGYILDGMEFWFEHAHATDELKNVVEQEDQELVRAQDLKLAYPVLLRAINKSCLPTKKELYNRKLECFRTHLRRFHAQFVYSMS